MHRWRRGSFVGAYGETYQIFGPVGAARLLAPGVAAAAGAGAPPHCDLAPLDELARGSAIERVTALATRGYLTNQLLRDIDAVSMAHSLEVRVPYLDPVVVDTALSLPDSAKLGDVHGADPTAAPTAIPERSACSSMSVDGGCRRTSTCSSSAASRCRSTPGFAVRLRDVMR